MYLEFSNSRKILRRLQGRALEYNTKWYDTKMRWRVWGKGPRVLLVHGGHGSWTHWVRNIEELALHFEVVVPDLPGFGDSSMMPDATRSESTLTRMVDCLEHGLAQLPGNVPLVHLGAFSFGALVATRLAYRVRGLRTLTLFGPAGHGSLRRQTIPLINWQSLPHSEQRDALRQNFVPFMISKLENTDTLALECYIDACRAARFRSKGMSTSNSISAILPLIPCTVHLVWGESDVTATPTEAGPRLSALHHACDWSVVSDAGHWVQYEQADLVNALLLRLWLANLNDRDNSNE